MQEDRVEATRRAIALWNSGELAEYIALIEQHAHPDLEWHPVIGQAVAGEAKVYRGIDGVRRFWHDSRSVFDLDYDEARTEVRDVGAHLAVLGHASIRGRGSGIEFETPLAMVITYDEDGRMTRIDQYLSHAEALEAARGSE